MVTWPILLHKKLIFYTIGLAYLGGATFSNEKNVREHASYAARKPAATLYLNFYTFFFVHAKSE